MYDVFVIGAGPAGLTAAMYSARAGFKTALAEKFPAAGGQMALTDRIDNFPAVKSSDGFALAELMRGQAEAAGAEFIFEEALGISDGCEKTVRTDKGVYSVGTVIIASGCVHRRIGAEGEEKFAGRGVSYCAVCDGGFYKGGRAVVIGGGDSTLKEALYLSNICSEVVILHRRSGFRGSRARLEACRNAHNIEIITEAVCDRIIGNEAVGAIEYVKGGERFVLKTDAVFGAVGMVPASGIAEGVCDIDGQGYIIADENGRTSAEGIFAAGDVRTKKYRQIITACSDGACAAESAAEFLS